MKKQSVLNWTYGTVFGVILFFIIANALNFEPLHFAKNFLVYLVLVVGVLLALPVVLGFVYRYYAVKKLDDMYGRPGDHIPNILQFFGMLVTGSGVGYLWMSNIVQWCAKSFALNTWAWSFIRFNSSYEIDPVGWFWVAIILYCIGYGVASAVISNDNN